VAAITVSLLTRTDTSQSMVVWFLVIMAIGAGLLPFPAGCRCSWHMRR
jgi:hypothetical protein